MSFSSGTFSINTAGQPVVAGTVISSTAFNALTADLATGLSTCLLKDGTQTATAIIPFVLGLTIAGGNALTVFTYNTKASTFTFNGSGGSSGSVTMSMQRINSWVTVNFPNINGTTGTTSTQLTSNTAIDAGFRPAADQWCPVPTMVDNGAEATTPGVIRIATTGIFTIFRNASTGTAWTNSATAGPSAPFSITYFVG